ncbi:GntR family transcriptional regulator [Agreia pratensis]|uniref:GntR family transcriptional regulator n=1 Tax=Agreia pratensis TaxID=150121 RepID=A0A1X7KYL2_9MICO|nr:GntR family transcriptional regulator [Agreia pratensis]SMG46510.1 GntR family transcriptional regulator [Agreia pratensis]
MRASDNEELLDKILDLWRGPKSGEATLPSEPAIALATGASRNSVREALIRLEERGYVHRTQGARTALNMRLAEVGNRVDRQIDHSVAIARAGYEPGLRVVESGVITLEAGPDRFDDLPDGTLALRTVKMWSADGLAYVVAEDIIPITDSAPPLDVETGQPVFDLAERLNGIGVAWETVWFTPVLVDSFAARLLSLTEPTAGLQLVYCGLGATDDVAYWSREIQIAAPTRLRNALVRRVRRS